MKSKTLFPCVGYIFQVMLLAILQGCAAWAIPYNDEIRFSDRSDLGLIELDTLVELSGIAASRRNPGVLWLHNDSGDENRIYAADTKGQHLGTYYLDGCDSGDWEDMAIGPGPKPEQSYLYVGNIGDNRAVYEEREICRVIEPLVKRNKSPLVVHLQDVETIQFSYPDSPRDAETLMVDPLNKDIYVVSKREKNVKVYRAAFPQSTHETIRLEYVATLPFGGVTSGDISFSGEEIVLKTLHSIFYWQRQSDSPLWDAFQQAPTRLPYVLEPQGEAIAWHAQGQGYYTVSEEAFKIPAHLYYYTRLK